jgi:amidohydrolase
MPHPPGERETPVPDASATVLATLDDHLPDLETLYQDLHRNPELSFQETRTAAEVVRRLEACGYQVTAGVGRTGVVGVLRNGPGPTVMLRADMDALPVKEATGLPYASEATGVDRDGKQVPVMHACGHDVHVTCLLGAARLLAEAASAWSGTLVLVFQPAEEVGGLFDRFGRPDVVLGQHVTSLPAGQLSARAGAAMAASDNMRITLYGRGAHGSKPEAAIDPVVMAASLVVRLQSVVSRGVAPDEAAVVTVGAMHAGLKENIIPDTAELMLTVRTFDPAVRERVLEAIRRMARAEALAAGATREPEFTTLGDFPVTVNDDTATARLMDVFAGHFGADEVAEMPALYGSEDFGVFGTAAKVPSVFWFLGGWDREKFAEADAAGRREQDIPSNHSPFFAPRIEPTLGVGVRALVVAALEWLDRPVG